MRRLSVLIVLVLLACSGCSSQPTETVEGPAVKPMPPLPTSQFGPIAGATHTGVSDYVTTVVTHEQTTVALGSVSGTVTRHLIRVSTDAGATWTEARLSPEISELEDLDNVIYTGSGWWALGTGAGEFWAVTSPDAVTWTRTKISGLDTDAVSVKDVTTTGTSLVLIGSLTSDQAVDPSAAFTSPDGVTWSKSASVMAARLFSVAYVNKRLVAVGRKVGQGDEQWAGSIWTSADGGRTWSEQPTPPVPPRDATFVTYLTQVRATPTGFVVIGAHFIRELGYQAYLLTSADGVSWTVDTTGIYPGATADGRLIEAGQQLYLEITPLEKSVTQTRPLLYQRVDGRWQPLSLAGDVAPGDHPWVVTGIVAGKGITRAFAAAGAQLVTSSALWQWSSTQVTLGSYPAATGRSAVVSPVAVAATRTGYVAVGSANGLPAIWYAGADRQFGAAQALSSDPQDAIKGVVVDGDQLLIWGSNNGQVSEVGVVFIGAVGSVPQRSLLPQGEDWDQYHYSIVNGAAQWQKQWLVVGEETVNGYRNRSAMVKSRQAPSSWASGEPANIADQGDETHYALSDLSGQEAQYRTINALAIGASGPMAVGARAGLDGIAKATYWGQLADGSWIMHPLPQGQLLSATANDVVMAGPVALVSGYGRAAGDLTDKRVFWRTTDAGQNWTMTTMELPGQAWQRAPKSTGSSFVMWGVPDHENPEPAYWTSPDGLTWKVVPQEGFRTDVERQQAMPLDAVVAADRQWVLVRIDTRDGRRSSTVFVERPLG